MGNQLRQPITSKVVETDGNAYYRVAVAAMNGYRECMEDSHCMKCTSEYGLFGVFDGHSGSQCSKFCATQLPLHIERKPPPLADEDLVAITLKIDEEFQADCKDSGCTACYFLSTRNEDGTFQVQVANVGDSRIIVGRNGGAECVSMTEDHKPGLEAEKERIERCGGTVHMDRVDGMLAMSRAMGDQEYKQGPGGPLEQKVIAKPDVTRTTCTSADWILVACDGVFESDFTNEQVVEFVKNLLVETEDDILKVVCAVCDEALKRGSMDNITCMLVQFKDGTSFKMPKPLFIPGPYLAKGNFREAYKGMAEKAGLTLGQALEMRYDMVRHQMIQRIQTIKSQDEVTKQDEELKTMQEELAYFKPGPLKLEGAARTKWFEELANKPLAGSTEDGPLGMDADTLEQLKMAFGGSGGGALLNRLKVVGDPAAADHPVTNDAASSSAASKSPDRKPKRKAGKGK